MHTSDFDFDLPPELIAQEPLARRDASRLLHVRRSDGATTHRTFADLPVLLGEGDLLVLNDSKVIPARLLGQKRDTGGRVELLLVRPASSIGAEAALTGTTTATHWICLGQASKPIRPGARLTFEGGLEAEIVEARGGGEFVVAFTSSAATLQAAIAIAGRLPLPPYIHRAPSEADADRYQTVYAKTLGSVAAPTAGLHFTPQLLDQLASKGVRRATITLEVGPGTFMPVRDGDVGQHVMHSERYVVSEEAAEAIASTKRAGGRVVAVGTTVTRTLESFTDGLVARSGETAIFITPGFEFRIVDALLTNFHLPKSTLVMLVSAFLGRERTLAAYAEAIRERYRFFSYGDAMFIEGTR